MTKQMKEGWAYLWLKKEWPAFVELEDKRGEHRLYVPEQRIADLEQTIYDVLDNATDTVWVGDAETLLDRMIALGIGDAE